jgi:hypothetical protein
MTWAALFFFSFSPGGGFILADACSGVLVAGGNQARLAPTTVCGSLLCSFYPVLTLLYFRISAAPPRERGPDIHSERDANEPGIRRSRALSLDDEKYPGAYFGGCICISRAGAVNWSTPTGRENWEWGGEGKRPDNGWCPGDEKPCPPRTSAMSRLAQTALDMLGQDDRKYDTGTCPFQRA